MLGPAAEKMKHGGVLEDELHELIFVRRTDRSFEPEPVLPTSSHNAKERSTVGSASATGSIGGHTNWASESDMYDHTDKMSEDQEMDTSSTGGFSDEGNASLVGFGEGASSTL